MNLYSTRCAASRPGSTLDTRGPLFANRFTGAHVIEAAAGVPGLDRARLLHAQELAAVDGVGNPAPIIEPVSQRRDP